MNDVTRILIVEDQSSDYELAQREIRKAIPNCQFQRAEKEAEFLEALREFQPDIILSDYKLPQFDGMRVLELVQQRPSSTPVIIWTGAMSEDVAVECMKQGASNYVLKENIKRLGPAASHVLKERKEILERKQAEKKFRDIFEYSPVGIFQSSLQGRFIRVNAAMARIYGYASPQEMIDSITDIASQIYIEAQDRSQFTQLLQTNVSVENFEMKNIRKDGSLFWTSTSARAVSDETGTILYYEGFLQDISDRKLAESKLLESEARYHGIFDNVQDGIFVESLEGDILEVNQRACEIFGYTRQEFLQKKVTDIVPSQGYIMNGPDVNLFPGQTIETINVRANGEHFPVEISGGLYEFGERSLFLVILRDITERKEAEQQLRMQERHFRALIENGMDNISLLARDGTLLWENPAVNSTLGYEHNEFVNRNIFELMHPDDEAWTSELFAKVVAKPGNQQSGTFRLRHHNSTWRWMETTATNMLEEPSVKAIVINYRDVTERKIAEEGLRKSQMQYQSLVETSHDLIWAVDGEGKITFINHAARDLYGEEPEELIGRSFFELLAPQAEFDRTNFKEMIGRADEYYAVESHVRHKDGRQFILSANSIVLRDEQGNVTGVTGTSRDITKRKHAEDALQEERNLLRTLIDNLPDRIYAMDRQGRKTLSNSADWKASGKKTMEEVIGKTDFDLYPPELAKPFWESNKTVIDSGQPLINFEEPGLDFHGNRVSVLTTKIPLRDEEGNVVGLVGVGRDITERKQAEAKINDLLSLNEKMLNYSPLGVLTYKLSGECVFANEKAAFIIGTSIENLISQNFHSIEAWKKSGLYTLVQKAISTKTVAMDDLHHISTFGKDIWLTAHCVTFTFNNEEHVLLSLLDITERKRAEQKLRDSEERFRLLFENSGEAILITQTDGTILSANPEACRMFGRSEEEIQKLGRTGIVDSSDPRLPLAIEERNKTGQFKGELRLLRKDGSQFPAEVSTAIFMDSSGNPKTSMTIRDITERRRSEVAEREQRVLAEALRDTSQMLSSSLDYGEVLDHILTAVGQVVPHDAATIMLIDNGFAHVVRSQGYEKRASNEEITGVRLALAETTNLRTMLETKQPVIVYDTYEYSGWKRMEATDWLRSSVGAPISTAGKVIGFVMLDSEAPGFFTPVHAEHLEAFANQAAVAIHNAELLQQAQNEIAERKRVEEELRQSENRYRTVVENQTEFIVRWKPDGTRTFVNDAYCRYYGITVEHALSTGFIPLIHEDDRQMVEEKISRLLSGVRMIETDVHRVIKQDGSIGWNEWTDQAIYNENGQLVEFQAVGRDITERKRAEEELRASEERFRQLADNIEEVFWMTDARTDQELYISPAGEKIWGLSLDDLFSDPNAFIQTIAVEDQPDVRRALEREKNGERVEIEYRVTQADGTVHWVWDRAFPIFDENGKVKTLAGIAADVTKRKQAEERLRESEERYHGLFQNLLDGSALHEIITDDQNNPIDYVFLEINPAFEKLTGLTAKDTVGRRATEIFPGIENERFIPIYGQVALTGQPVHFEEYFVALNKYFEINAYSPQHRQVAVTFVDVTERKRSEKEIDRRAKETSALLETSLTLTNLDLKSILQTVGNAATSLFAADGCRIFLMQPDGESLSCVLALQENEAAFLNLRIRLGEGVTGNVAASGKAEIINDMLNDPRGIQVAGTEEEQEAIMFAPLKERDHTIGVLSIRRASAERPFQPADLELLEAFASMAASAVSKARLFEEAQQRLAELEAIYENGLAVSQLLEPREIGQRIIETFAHYLSWHHVTIRLLRPDTDKLEVIAFNLPGLNEDQKIEMEHHFNQMVSKTGQGLSGWVTQTGTPIRTGNVQVNPRYVDTQAGIHSGLYMPLKVADRVIGVISVESKSPDAFTEQDERLLATLASQAAVAFENARLYQAAHQELLERTRAQAALWASETHYRELADSITDILFELDYNLICTHWNKASEMFSGIPAEDAIGKTIKEVWGESTDQLKREEIYKRVLSERQARTFEVDVLAKDRKQFLEIHAYPSTRGVSVVARDITERKLTEKLMEKRFGLIEYSSQHSTTEVLQKVIDEVSELTDSHIGFMHFVEEDETTITLEAWSTETLRDFCQVEGGKMHSSADRAGVWADAIREHRSLIHNDYESLPNRKGLPEGHAQVIREIVIPIIRGEKAVAVMGMGNKPKDYTQHDIEIVERFADYAWDIIERRQMEAALADERNQLARRVEERTADLSRANSNLARALRVKDEFLANMSHELRTPLNAILGLSESLSEQVAGPLNEKQQKYLSTINESGHHLLSLINDILDLAKIEAGQITLDINKADINSVCQASLRMVRQLAQKKKQEVLFDIDSGVGLMWADERRLKQMIVNLLSNAVKFTPESGQLGLEVHGDEAGNRVLITVWDKGIGIGNQDLERLFKPFVQLDSGLAREATGTGLGLALVAQMARLHGGSVSVESQVGEGSRFTILLPWEPALAVDASTRLRNTGKFRAIDPNAANKPTVLLIEDTREVVMMLVDYLEMSGFKMITAQDGTDGIQQAKLFHPNLILMDVMMPGMDGFETTRRLRQDPQFKDTPIIALTALAMPSDRQRCLDAGMDEYISKPVNLKALVKLIQNILLEKEDTKPK